MSTEAKCSCQFCNGHIAFAAEMAGQMVACPHCGLETKLFIPNVAKAPAAKNPPQTVSVETKRGVSPLGIASLVLGIIACIFCWIPLLGLLVLPLALIGLVLAIVGLILAGVSKKTGFAFPVSGLIVCLLSGFIAVAITGSLAAAFARGKTNQPRAGVKSARPARNFFKRRRLVEISHRKTRRYYSCDQEGIIHCANGVRSRNGEVGKIAHLNTNWAFSRKLKHHQKGGFYRMERCGAWY